MATELIIEWTEEETSGGKGVVQHNPEDMETNDEGLIVELPNALLERDDYDNVLASRIVRKAPKTGDFVKSLLVVERVRAKAHAVHDMLEKKKHTFRAPPLAWKIVRPNKMNRSSRVPNERIESRS